MNINETVETRWDRVNKMKDLKFELSGYFIGDRSPSDEQMVKVESLRVEIAALENELRYG